jgi:hypothetical protein
MEKPALRWLSSDPIVPSDDVEIIDVIVKPYHLANTELSADGSEPTSD